MWLCSYGQVQIPLEARAMINLAWWLGTATQEPHPASDLQLKQAFEKSLINLVLLLTVFPGLWLAHYTAQWKSDEWMNELNYTPTEQLQKWEFKTLGDLFSWVICILLSWLFASSILWKIVIHYFIHITHSRVWGSTTSKPKSVWSIHHF